jgi:hypothetical protein
VVGGRRREADGVGVTLFWHGEVHTTTRWPVLGLPRTIFGVGSTFFSERRFSLESRAPIGRLPIPAVRRPDPPAKRHPAIRP